MVVRGRPPTSDPAIRSQLLPLALRAVRDAGAIVPAGFDPDAIEIPVVLSTLVRVLDECSRALRDPALGVTLAETRRTGSHGLIEFFWRSRETVRSAARTFASLSRLVNDATRIEIEEGDDRTRILQRIDGAKRGLGRHGNAFFVATLVREIRTLVDPHFRPERLLLAHGRPDPGLSRLREFTGCRQVELDADGTGIVLASRWLEGRIGTADPSLASALDAHASQFLAPLRAAPSSSFAAGVSALVRSIEDGAPSLDEAARRLGTSSRTLQRRLAAEGTTFQAIVDAVRVDRAKVLLVAGSRVKEVAVRVGFTTTAAFTRAFRRQVGVTPHAFRKGSEGEDQGFPRA
jgi:AraC-like DNA-binding protein